MSVMEKRLQLLLDAERYALVSQEATRSGRSVASVIREAIDVRFEQAEAQTRRAAALGEFLALGPDEDGQPEDVVAALQGEFEDHLDRKGGP
ncbi:hypothetical protein [Ornithinimicrobium cryptoxanthini]|uniref:Uncharacterized protein n=1 Tax=Ornithinimicrobium cryptoxanthini TaxID=2934161 RepID=A0ABY4YFL2_9MICO|nr:hypothetical protein [Ornithinimicrobium cryptoxanthini]USQ75568.1 hypothetical protein NF557_13240 [Ornithinimicrobium cryptoxanthini]